MKNRKQFLIGLIGGVILLYGCKKSESKWESTYNGVDYCVKVVDADSKLAISSASVYCIDGWISADTVFKSVTDATGKLCHIPNRAGHIIVVKTGYLGIEYFAGIPKTLELRKPAYAYLHIKNDPIALASDSVSVTYFLNTITGQYSTINLTGMQDTVIFVSVDPKQDMQWSHNNSLGTLFKSINISGGDTINVDFFY